MKLWAGRFNKPTDKLVNEYNESISFDHQLGEYDITGSLAHAAMLRKCGFLTEKELSLIRNGLKKIRKQLQDNSLTFQLEDEDIHMNIERLLHAEVGDVAGKLHLGRSRNDQVALDLRLYMRSEIIILIGCLHELLKTLHQLAKTNLDVILPGFTHLQHAEPVRFGHHLLAYFNMFARDVKRLCSTFDEVNCCPLGAGALAGSGIDIDRNYVAQLLHFPCLSANSLDAVSDRDFVVDFLANASLVMMHISRLSEELILWSSQEFAYIQLDDAFCTGSSMMPQKKNPDVCELARGKTGRVYGFLLGLLTTLKGLPLAYNKDLQEDKEGLFDAVKTLKHTLSVFAPMLRSMQVNQDVMEQSSRGDFSNATNLANYLAKKGISFRKAHELTGKIVRYCLDNHCLLDNLGLAKLKQFCSVIDDDVYSYLTLEAVVETHNVLGGTAKKQVEQQITGAENQLITISTWLSQHQSLLNL